LPELAVLRFGVYDDNNKLLGQRILPFEDLQAGYRHIALRTEGNFAMTLPMLFCKIELKVFIPEGLNDLMDALSDPRNFLQKQEERRIAQLHNFGINEEDYDKDNIIGQKRSAVPGPKQTPVIPGVKGKPPDEKEEKQFDAITPELVKSEKSFIKLTKKHQRELDTMRKKQQKERSGVQKNQCTAIEKLVKSKGRDNDVVNDPVVKQVVVDQTKQWSEMVERHRKENWELMRNHLQSQEDLLKELMQAQQQVQMKELESLFKKEGKEIRDQQACVSLATKDDVNKDPTLKTKAERERILRERNANNTKKFIEERKTLAVRQEKRREKLKNQHEMQLNNLDRYVQNSMEMYKNEEIEYQLAAKQECFV